MAGIFFRQNLIIYFAGLCVAFPLGYGLTVAAARAYDTELYRMPVVLFPATLLATGLTTFSFVMLAQWFVYRQIRRLHWAEGLTVKE